MSDVAPLLILAIGNPSRGDDALGPVLLDRLQAAGIGADGGVELLADFQLQVEHALDLQGRRGVLFVDAACPGCVQGVGLQRLQADAQVLPTSHALRPQAVLQVALRLHGRAPPAWLLAIEGRHFALGEGLSADAAVNLERAMAVALDWAAKQGGAPGGDREG